MQLYLPYKRAVNQQSVNFKVFTCSDAMYSNTFGLKMNESDLKKQRSNFQIVHF